MEKIKIGEVAEISFVMKIESVVDREKDALAWGWTEDGTYCCVPLNACRKVEHEVSKN